MDWPERLAIIAFVTAAVTLLVFGGFLSALAFALCGFMGCTRAFEQVRTQGKPTLSNKGRAVVATVLAIVGIALFPRGGGEPQKAEPAPQPTFGKIEAIEACKEGVIARAAHPSTVEFPMLDYDFREYAESKSELLMSAKARNGFNLQLEYDVECDFTGTRLEAVIMSEAAPRS